MASLLRRSGSLAPARRAFSTSTPRLASLQWDRNNKEVLADTVPEYPYGAPTLYKQSRYGLYGEQRIRFVRSSDQNLRIRSKRSEGPSNSRHRIPRRDNDGLAGDSTCERTQRRLDALNVRCELRAR